VYRMSGEFERARQMGRESIELARKLGDDAVLVHALASMANLASPDVMELYAEAIACCERAGYLSNYYSLHNDAGCMAMLLGDIASAHAYLEEAIRSARDIGYSPAYPWANLGLVLRAEDDIAGARSAFEEAIRVSRRNGAKVPMAAALHGLACLAGDMSDWPRAATLHGAAQALIDQTGRRWDTTEECQRAECLDQIAAAVGDEQLRQAYDAGTALSIGDAIDLALGKSSPH